VKTIVQEEGSESIDVTFSDIEELSDQCRFTDCQHETEPGCAVNCAIEDGTLEKERLVSYRKLQREIAYAMRKQDLALARAERESGRR
jgi:ribosome biogenesis GTPase